jgi:hypothetical protein
MISVSKVIAAVYDPASTRESIIGETNPDSSKAALEEIVTFTFCNALRYALLAEDSCAEEAICCCAEEAMFLLAVETDADGPGSYAELGKSHWVSKVVLFTKYGDPDKGSMYLVKLDFKVASGTGVVDAEFLGGFG